MSAFHILTDLPHQTQLEVARIQAIPVAQRLTSEVNFLTALGNQLTNEVIEKDTNGLVLTAAGNTLPTGASGFRKGAEFVKKNAAGNGSYINVGDETSASWSLVEENAVDITPTVIAFAIAL